MAKSDIDPDLLKQAEELNIEVTDTATAEAVKEAIDAALAEDAAAAASVAKLRADYKELVGKNAFNGWDAEELQKRIDAALAGNPQPQDPAPVAATSRKPKTMSFKIERDFWDENGDRHRAGSIVEMTAEDALAGIESGAISRVKADK
ncbi:hypothetical protein [Agrobacterium sp. ST15.13.015]|uniref:hypothetical protein n=1 Tax=Agrobacterium sp. ST15.13.015 TaxID=3017319 RepID=UPI0022BEA4EB|nr:hypothetical protein [Agrobacterium sp. ST15.13.015]MCZ7502031.1 hypothetical protein [Rhizobium rhizogenes]